MSGGGTQEKSPTCVLGCGPLEDTFMPRSLPSPLFLLLALPLLPIGAARADNKPAPAPAAAGAKPAAEAPKCKTWGAKPMCCDPAIAAHLPKEAVFSACGESEA